MRFAGYQNGKGPSGSLLGHGDLALSGAVLVLALPAATENARPVGATMSKRPEAARAEHVAALRRPKLGNPFARELDQGMAPDRPLHRF